MLPYPISTVGPIARNPEDLSMLLQTILPKRRKTDFDASKVIDKSKEDLNTLVNTSKIGWLADWGGSLPFEDGVLSHCRRSLEVLESGGCSIEHISTAPFPNDELWEAWLVIRSNHIFTGLQESIGCETRQVIPTLTNRGVKREAIWECECGISQTPQDLKLAIQKVHDWSLCADDVFKTYDFLALPSSQVYPFDASIDWPKTINGKKMDTYHRWMEVMVPVTLLGTPCVTLPAIKSYGLLPIGIQIFAKRGMDAKLLELARWYHENLND